MTKWVTDQLEVETRSAYSGTYLDNIMIGSTLRSGSLQRRRIASNGALTVNVDTTALAYSRFTVSEWYRLVQPTDIYGYGTRGAYGMGFMFSRLQCPAERYHDSVLPDPVEVYQRGSGSLTRGGREFYDETAYTVTSAQRSLFPETASTSSFVMVLGFADFHAILTGSDGYTGGTSLKVSDNKWLSAFPWEERYAGLARYPNPTSLFDQATIGVSASLSRGRRRQFELSQSWDDLASGRMMKYVRGRYYGTQPTLQYVTPGTALLQGPFNLTTDFSGAQYTTVLDFTFDLTTFYPQIGKHHYPGWENLYRHFWGFGDGYGHSVEFNYSTAWLNHPNIASSDPVTDWINLNGSGSAPIRLGRGAILRGWKYGLASGLPCYSSMVFRRGRFGQFRDILEQRIDTKFYDEAGIGTGGPTGGTIGAKLSPVTLEFTVGSQAYLTSSNLDLNREVYTSGSGFWDKEYRVTRPYADQGH